MTKKRRRKNNKPTENPVERVLGELLGEVKNSLVQSVQQMLLPPPQFREPQGTLGTDNLQKVRRQMERMPPVIKDAEVISIRKG